METRKGVFGLATSPRPWWRKIAKHIAQATLAGKDGKVAKLEQHRRGAARLDEKEIKDEEHKWNVTRCVS